MTDLQSHDKTLMNKGLLINDQSKWFLEMELAPVEDSVRVVETTTKTFRHYINLVDKALAEFEKIDFNFERSTMVENTIRQHCMLQRNHS